MQPEANPVISSTWAVLLPIALTVLTSVLVWVMAQVGKLMKARASTSRFGAIALRGGEFAASVVADLEATLKASLQEKAKDGLTKEEIYQLRDEALQRVKVILGDRGLKELAAAGGVLMGAPLDMYLSGVIEQQVSNLKKTSEVVAVVKDTPKT